MVLHRYKQSRKRLFLPTTKSAALLLKSVEYDRCWRRTARPRVTNPCHSRCWRRTARPRAGSPCHSRCLSSSNPTKKPRDPCRISGLAFLAKSSSPGSGARRIPLPLSGIGCIDSSLRHCGGELTSLGGHGLIQDKDHNNRFFTLVCSIVVFLSSKS